MYVGGSLVLLAVGAICSFAVTDRIDGVDVTMIGYILMAVGALGVLLSLVMRGDSGARRRDDVY